MCVHECIHAYVHAMCVNVDAPPQSRHKCEVFMVRWSHHNLTATCKINGNRSDGVPVVNWCKSAVEKPIYFASRGMNRPGLITTNSNQDHSLLHETFSLNSLRMWPLQSFNMSLLKFLKIWTPRCLKMRWKDEKRNKLLRGGFSRSF